MNNAVSRSLIVLYMKTLLMTTVMKCMTFPPDIADSINTARLDEHSNWDSLLLPLRRDHCTLSKDVANENEVSITPPLATHGTVIRAHHPTLVYTFTHCVPLHSSSPRNPLYGFARTSLFSHSSTMREGRAIRQRCLESMYVCFYRALELTTFTLIERS